MTTDELRAISDRTVLLFDGRCGLCNGVIRFLLHADRAGRLLYVPLESALGQELYREDVDGVVLIEAALTARQVVTVRSDAAIRVFRLLPGAWPLAGRLLAAVPRSLREAAYGVIARVRYRLFGRYDVCPLRTPAERARVLGANG